MITIAVTTDNFHIKSDFSSYFAENIHCGYTLESLRVPTIYVLAHN